MYHGKTISVVMTTYNGSNYVIDQLRSITNQSLGPDEILILDDGSSDNTVEIINEYIHENDHKHVCTLIRNRIGLGFARNFLLGIEKSTGDYVYLSDQDDVWDEKKIEIMTEIMHSNDHIESLSCSYDLIDETGRKINDNTSYNKKGDGRLEKEDWKNFIKHPAGFPGMSLLITRTLINRVLKQVPQSGEIPAHDWLLNEEAAKCDSLYKLNKVLVHYRQHGNNQVGTLLSYEPEVLLKNREYVLNSYIVKHFYMYKKYSDSKEIKDLMIKLIMIDRSRCINLEKKKVINSLLLYLNERKHINARTMLGDILVMIKCKDTSIFKELKNKSEVYLRNNNV